jgi:hypothetical protein
MAKRKLTPEEEEWGATRDFHWPPLVRLLKGLHIATNYDPDKRSSTSAAIALVAISHYVKAITPTQQHLLAPLLAALEIVESTIEPERVPSVRRVTNLIVEMDGYKGWPIPPLKDFVKPLKDFATEVVLPKGVSSKLFATVAVEFQLMNSVPLEQALRNVVGNDPRARKRLKDFRYNMKEKNSPKGARQEYFSLMQRAKTQLAGKVPSVCAEVALAVYREHLGKKS